MRKGLDPDPKTAKIAWPARKRFFPFAPMNPETRTVRFPLTMDAMNPGMIVIVGRPNVGKSTLFNRLTKSRSALVDDRPGITRDRLQASLVYEGTPFTLVDTGGFDDFSEDPLLRKVHNQVATAVEEAGAVIFLVDGRQGLMPGDERMADLLRRSGKPVFLAVNKIEGPEHDHRALEFYELGVERVYPISASHGYGVQELLDEAVRHVQGARPHEEPDRIRVAVLGKPNAGKSSLINRILRSERLLVDDLPGTTRDAVDTPFQYRGKEYLLIDTAGIRRKAKVREKIEKFSVIKALGSLDRCHVCLALLDASQGVTEQDARICGYAFERNRGMVLGLNKWDLVKGNPGRQQELRRSIERQLQFLSFAPRVNLSALTGERVMRIFDKIDLVFEQYSSRVPTPAVNRAIRAIMEKHPPSRTSRGKLRFSYATQSRIRPPTFVIFVNRSDLVHFSYKRFLVNQLREYFGLEHTPVRLIIRDKKRT